MERIIHTLIQGSPEWHQFRLEHDGASEAAPMLGLSKNVSRTELLHVKHTGIAKEFSDFVQEHILDNGHKVEALARPMAEAILGDELYPATYSFGTLSASCDGLTMDGVTAFEHKQANAGLIAALSRGELPEEHQPQCQQIMLVTGAERVLFMVSDGTPENCAYMFVEPDSAWQSRIVAGWKQFNDDLAAYKPVEVMPAAVAAPTMALPALSIQVNGSISLIDNLAVFGAKLGEFIDGLNKSPDDDQGFADAEAAVKTLKTAEGALEAAEASALAQTASIDEMRRTVALYANQARTARLELEKLVKLRKDSIRVEIAQNGKDALAAHVAMLNKRLGKPYLPAIVADFAGVMKGKKTIASLRDAVDTELARVKIASNEIADKIEINLNTLRELAKDHVFLFADTAQIVLKANDDLVALVKNRIAEHNQAEAKRMEAERERIRAEEVARLEREAKAKDQPAAQPAPVPSAPTSSPELAQNTKLAGAAVPSRPAPKRPSRDQIIEVIATTFLVSNETATGWLEAEFQQVAA